MKRLQTISAITLAATTLFVAACHHIDDDRLPPAPVRLTFNTVAEWNI